MKWRVTMEIKIKLVDDTLDIKTKGNIDIDLLLQMLCTAALGSMNNIISQIPEETKEEAKALVYDQANMAFSRTLEAFAPEYELRPNLTAQAILEAENRIIMEDRLSEVAPGS